MRCNTNSPVLCLYALESALRYSHPCRILASALTSMSPLVIMIGCWCVGLAGCGTISDATSSVRDRLAARDEGRSKSYAAPVRTAYDAVRVAAGQMGYRVVRGGAARGEVQAVSSVASGEGNRSSRQVSLYVRLVENGQGGTDINVRFTEILEIDSANRPGQATETPLRDTPQYQVFFRAVQQALLAQPKK